MQDNDGAQSPLTDLNCDCGFTHSYPCGSCPHCDPKPCLCLFDGDVISTYWDKVKLDPEEYATSRSRRNQALDTGLA